jgi:DNA-binding response OmpR family regulator
MGGHRADAGAQTTILVVEDDEGVRDLIRKALAPIGARLLVAGSAADAVVLAADEHVDLLLADVVLPGASGPELAAQLRAARPTLQVIYITGWDDHSALAGVPEGVPLLKKPFDVWELAQAVTSALSK